MKNKTNTASSERNSKEMTLKDYYMSLAKPVVISEKQNFLDRIAKLCEVSDTTVRNWCMYGFRPQKQKWVDILVQETGIPAENLFNY